MNFLLMISTCTFLLLLETLIEFIFGFKSIKSLTQIPPHQDQNLPKVSVIIPARNEERNIKPALHSIINQDYPNLEIIVINDRSTDNTGQILSEVITSYPKVKLLDVSQLPAGWLGKNHALYTGAQMSSGDFLLFTDADVVMEKTTLRRAIQYLLDNDLDHLAVGPRMAISGLFLKMAVNIFMLVLALFMRPWRARNPRSRFSVGVGAFNLVRTVTYQKVGTYKSLAMRPDEDYRFGRLIKSKGFRQDSLKGDGMICVEWYSSFREMARGLEKNIFAGFDYNLPRVILGTLALSLFFLFPFIGIFLTSNISQVFFIVSASIILFLYGACGKHMMPPKQYSLWFVFTFPFAFLILLFLIWNSTLKALVNNGISWRDTHYSLKELKSRK